MSKKKCVNIAVLTVSDTRTEADDKSGQVLVDRIKDAGHYVLEDAHEIILPMLKEFFEMNQI